MAKGRSGDEDRRKTSGSSAVGLALTSRSRRRARGQGATPNATVSGGTEAETQAAWLGAATHGHGAGALDWLLLSAEELGSGPETFGPPVCSPTSRMPDLWQNTQKPPS